MFEVYCHTSPSGKQYVGWTSRGWGVRWRKHLESARTGSRLLFHCAVRKYGAHAFRHELLSVCDTESGAKDAEVRWIAARRTMTPAGYNATSGGDGAAGLVMSAATLARMHEVSTGKTLSADTRAKISRAARNRPLEQIEKQIAAQTGRKRSEAFRLKQSTAWTPEMRRNLGERTAERNRHTGRMNRLRRAWLAAEAVF